MSTRFILFDNKPYGIRAGGIVVCDGKVLMIHRIRNDQEYYVFPGGGVDPGETVQQGIVREILEETNQNVVVEHILYHLDFIDDSDQYYGLCHYIGGGDLRLNGPEAEKQSDTNRHIPVWAPIENLLHMDVYPVIIRDWFVTDYPAILQGEKPTRHQTHTYMGERRSSPAK